MNKTKANSHRMNVRLTDDQLAYVTRSADKEYRTPQQEVQRLLDQAILRDGYTTTPAAVPDDGDTTTDAPTPLPAKRAK